MSTYISLLLQALALSVALSIDNLVTAISYRASRIKIPLSSTIIITTLTTAMLMVGMLSSRLLSSHIDSNTARLLSAGLLMALGLTKLLYIPIKAILMHGKGKSIRLRLFSCNIIIGIMSDSTAADSNHDKRLSAREALTLAFALSIDGLATGVSIGLGNMHIWIMIATSFTTGMLALLAGRLLGSLISRRLPRLQLSWLTGVILLALGIVKLVSA